MTFEEQSILQAIVAETEQLVMLARKSGGRLDFLAFLLEGALHEARATLIGEGQTPPTSAPASAAQGGRSVVQLRPHGKPTKP